MQLKFTPGVIMGIVLGVALHAFSIWHFINYPPPEFSPSSSFEVRQNIAGQTMWVPD